MTRKPPSAKRKAPAKAACAHPPTRLYSWFAADGVLCVACCECQTILCGAAEPPSSKSKGTLT